MRRKGESVKGGYLRRVSLQSDHLTFDGNWRRLGGINSYQISGGVEVALINRNNRRGGGNKKRIKEWPPERGVSAAMPASESSQEESKVERRKFRESHSQHQAKKQQELRF